MSTGVFRRRFDQVLYRRPLLLPTAAAGGQTFFSTVTGTLSTVGALNQLAATQKTATLTTAGALGKQAETAKGGTLTTAGALLKQAGKAFTGTLTSSGMLVSIKTILLALTGTLATAGALFKQAETAKGGTLTTAGALNNVIGKMLLAALSPVGVLLATLNGLVVNFIRLSNVKGAVERLFSIVGRTPGPTDIEGK